ncbi:Hypothetical_protein [Hexamita inflata]|uniref:Hypothetical_protein n=1 Tax=Hexamita inflata TaxID=28002 RepID=A0ABP1JT14_9EUKA
MVAVVFVVIDGAPIYSNAKNIKTDAKALKVVKVSFKDQTFDQLETLKYKGMMFTYPIPTLKLYKAVTGPARVYFWTRAQYNEFKKQLVTLNPTTGNLDYIIPTDSCSNNTMTILPDVSYCWLVGSVTNEKITSSRAVEYKYGGYAYGTAAGVVIFILIVLSLAWCLKFEGKREKDVKVGGKGSGVKAVTKKINKAGVTLK